MTVNNYPVSIYQSGEVTIQTNPKQLDINGGMVYLTELKPWEMLKLLEEERWSS